MSFLQKGIKMNRQAKILMQILGISTVLVAAGAYAADDKNAAAGEVLFKIHDVVPEKDANGKVLYCNVGATFFNRTKMDIANASLTLKWSDDVIGEVIDQEERADKEQKRLNPKAERSRYSTSGFTSKTINTSLKLPPMKSNQQVSLKTKVDTNRCFLLLNDMDITVNNCGTASMNDKISRQGCGNLFRYVSPKMAEYYMEFKEISPEEQMAIEDAELDVVQKDLKKAFEDTTAIIQGITEDAPVADRTQPDAVTE